MKFFIWVIEFKIKRKENEDKLRYLVERLFKELELQGHNAGSVSITECKCVSIFEHLTSFVIYSGGEISICIEKQVNEHGR